MPGKFAGLKLRQREAAYIDEGHSAGEALAALLGERRRSAAKDEKARGGGLTVSQHPQEGKEVGTALYLVEDHQPGQGEQGQRGIAEAGEVIR